MDLVVVVVVAFAVASIVVSAVAWRFASRRYVLPCPAALAWLLESRIAHPLMDARRTLAALQVGPGMSVLDAGCGAGRVTLPLARAVGPGGSVLAVDVQERMLEKVRDRAKKEGLDQVKTMTSRLGSGQLPRDAFDAAVLVTVLGELPEPVAGLRELRDSLRPGGRLAVTEVFPDPHFCSPRRVAALGEAAGLRRVEATGPWFAHTTVFERG